MNLQGLTWAQLNGTQKRLKLYICKVKLLDKAKYAASWAALFAFCFAVWWLIVWPCLTLGARWMADLAAR